MFGVGGGVFEGGAAAECGGCGDGDGHCGEVCAGGDGGGGVVGEGGEGVGKEGCGWDWVLLTINVLFALSDGSSPNKYLFVIAKHHLLSS